MGISGPEIHRTKYGGGPTGGAGERMCVVFARDALSASAIIGKATETKPLQSMTVGAPGTGWH